MGPPSRAGNMRRGAAAAAADDDDDDDHGDKLLAAHGNMDSIEIVFLTMIRGIHGFETCPSAA